MATLVDQGFGLELSVGAPMAADGHLRMRVDLGAVVYGCEELFYGYCRFTCRVASGSNVTTTNSILYGSVGPEIVLASGDFEPYVHAGASVSYFVTSSQLDDNDGYGSYMHTTNYSDTVLGWRFGGGFRFRVGQRTLIDVGVHKADNQVATYLTEGDVVDDGKPKRFLRKPFLTNRSPSLKEWLAIYDFFSESRPHPCPVDFAVGIPREYVTHLPHSRTTRR